jgi:predicted deacylase
VVCVEGAAAGPTLAVTGNIHGDELTGIGAVHALAARLDGRLRTGRVLLYPSLNPEALRQGTRRVPADDRDLNRCFPGDPAGGPSDRLAHAAWRDLVGRRVDVLVDVHADAPHALPYVVLDRGVHLARARRAEVEARAEALAHATGLTVLRDLLDAAYVSAGLDRTLTGSVVNGLGIPAFTLEAGPRGRLDAAAVEIAVDALLGLLDALGMLETQRTPHPSRVEGGPWRRAVGPRARTDGILVATAPPGAWCAAGAPVAEIRGLDGQRRALVRAETDGFVVSHAHHGHVVAGTATCTWAHAEEPA